MQVCVITALTFKRYTRKHYSLIILNITRLILKQAAWYQHVFIYLFVLSRTSNFSTTWRLVTGLQI
jgi:hypothetical protein